jgi:hypothetical protein
VNASKENPMKKRAVATLLAAGLLATTPAPASAWVAAGGYHGRVAVGYRPPCCYSSGPSVAGAVVAGAIVGAAVASAAKPAPAPVYVAPAPVYYAAPVTYAPAVGTVVASLPGGCGSTPINGISYMNCGGTYYMPFYSGGALMYQVTIP